MATGTLTGQTIANTYKALLKITGTTAGGETLHATTQKVIEDGDGNPFPFSAAQDAILMTGTSRIEFNDAGEYISGDGTDLTITSGADIILTPGAYVGLGTTSPAKLLHISGAADNGLLEGLQIDNTDWATTETGQAVAINMRMKQNSTMRDAGRITVGKDDDWDDAAATDSHMTFKTMLSNTLTEHMRIDSAGNIGIGVTDPDNKLEIVGGSDAPLTLKTADTRNGIFLKKPGSDDIYGSVLLLADDTFRLGTQNVYNINMLQTGDVGIGTASPAAKLDVTDTTINTTASYTGLRNVHEKTLGTTNGSDSFTGLFNSMVFNDADQFFNSILGFANYTQVQAALGGTDGGTGESTDVTGIYQRTKMDDGDVGSLWGHYNFVDFDGGIVDAQVHGQDVYVDISAGTISDDIVVSYLNLGTAIDCGGTARMLVMNMNGSGLTDNADQFLYCYDDVNNDIVAQILFANTAAVATFDGGDFAGAPDYAEYFESKNGKAIPVGTTVKLDGDKVVACSEGDTPIGIVRPDGQGTSAYKAGAQNLRWQGKYISNDYNEQQNEDYTTTKWTESITEEEYFARGKDETGGVLGGSVKDNKVEGSKAIPAKEAVTQQKTVDEEVEEEVTTTSLVDGKYVQKTETITKTVKVPQYNEVDLYDEDGEVIGKHQVPIMETVEEAVAGVDAVPDTYERTHSYHSDRIPDGVTAPDDAETITPSHKRKKLNPDFDASKVDGYTKRPERDEWNLIGLLGQIPITKGQPLGDNWIKMKDISDTVEMYFVK